MKVLIVYAHPEPQSLNGSLLQVAVDELKAQGHEVQVSDLYAMKWKSEVDRADFLQLQPDAPLSVGKASGEATLTNNLTEDVKREQEKLVWADTVILQFPFWWYSMPAIMKGWVERVFSLLFAFGFGEYNDTRWGDRYGEGTFVGKRAMLIVTAGSWREHYSERAITGGIDNLLFPINHGILYYTGFAVLPSFVVYNTERMNKETFRTTADELRQRLRTLSTTKPIAYRSQNGGDYEIPALTLKPGLEDAGTTGFSLHISKDSTGSQD